MLIHNADITGSLTINGIPFNSGSFSGSFRGDGSQLTGITGATTASYVEYSNVGNKPTLVSGSSQITYSGLTGIPSGIVSGSSQVSFNGIVDKPTLVSGSSQVTYSGLSGIPAGIVSGSSQVSFTGITDKPTLVSGSAQISYPNLSNIPNGIVSSSTQITGYNIFATTGSNTFNGTQTITGSIFGTGSLTIDGCITATGQIVAQTINVQQVTSSIVYSCGSNVFGTSINNTQTLCGNIFATGSLACFAGQVCSNTLSTAGAVNISGVLNGTTACFGNTGTGNNVLLISNNDQSNTRLRITNTGSGGRTYSIVGGLNGANNSSLSIYDETASSTRLEINSAGIACFACQVCAPSAIFSGNVTISGGNDLVFRDASNYISSPATDTLRIVTANSERVRITSTGIACFSCQVCAPVAIFSGCVGIGTTNPAYKLHVVTDAVASRQNMSNISRTTGNWVRFTNPQFSADASVGLLLRVFPDSDPRQGAGIIASGGVNNATTDLDLFVTTSPDGLGGTSYSAIKINGFNGNVGIGTTSPNTRFDVRICDATAYATTCSGNALTLYNVSTTTNAFVGIDFLGEPTAGNAGRASINMITVGSGNGDLTFGTRGSSVFGERMRITAGGNVGIGTCNPVGKLDVTLLNTRRFIVTYDDSIITIKGASDTGAGENLRVIGDNLIFNTNSVGSGTERLRISSTGIACFACQVCTPLLTVNAAVRLYGSAGGIGCAFIVTATGADEQPAVLIEKAGGFGQSEIRSYYSNVPNYGIAFRSGNTTGMYIQSQGNVGVGTNSPGEKLQVNGNTHISGVGNALYFDTDGTGKSITQFVANLYEFHILNARGNSSRFILGNSSISLGTSGTPYFTINTSAGVSCFSNTVCAPRFVGPLTGAVSGNLNGYPILAQTSCLLGGSSSDVTVYFTSNIAITYGINDYTVSSYLDGNSAVFSSLRALIPYNYYASSTSTVNLASYIDGIHSHSVLAVAVCKLGSSNTNCIAVRFAVSSGNVSGYRIAVTSNGMYQG